MDEFESATISKPSVFESLKFYGMLVKYLKLSVPYLKHSRNFGICYYFLELSEEFSWRLNKKKRVRISHGKRTISFRVIEALKYYLNHEKIFLKQYKYISRIA